MAADDGKRSHDEGEDECEDPFAQVNSTLIEKGCLLKPLDVSGMSSTARKTLAELLISMLSHRQDDATFREQLSSKLRTNESSLERTKRFWKEEEEKSADLSRKLETSKARIGTIAQELSDSQSNLKRTKEELQKAKRDLLNVKQQIYQQKQANERQIERLRARFSDESMKSLRLKVPEVYFATEKAATATAARSSTIRQSASLPSTLERRQIEELESKRRELLEYNTALKRYATESLNLAREAAVYLDRIERVYQPEESSDNLASSSSSSSSGTSTTALTQSRPSKRRLIVYQRDLFPPLYLLPSDYSVGSASSQKQQHPALQALRELTTDIQSQGSSLLKGGTKTGHMIGSASSAGRASLRLSRPSSDSNDGTVTETAPLDESHERLLSKALERVEELESELLQARERERDLSSSSSRREEREERIKQAAEVEKQRQRYLSLCRELEKQEELIRSEREVLQRDREEILKAEMSLSIQEGDSTIRSLDGSGMISATPLSLKRVHDDSSNDEKENGSVSSAGNKRTKMENDKASTPRENTMRFVTMRKQRMRLQGN